MGVDFLIPSLAIHVACMCITLCTSNIITFLLFSITQNIIASSVSYLVKLNNNVLPVVGWGRAVINDACTVDAKMWTLRGVLSFGGLPD